jgi:hypothetical protein
VLSLSNGDLSGSLVSTILVVSLLVVYSLLTSRSKIGLPSIDIETSVDEISFRTACILIVSIFVQVVLLGFRFLKLFISHA